MLLFTCWFIIDPTSQFTFASLYNTHPYNCDQMTSYKAEQALEDKRRSRSAVCKQCVACAGRTVIACRISCERYDVDVGGGVDQLIVTSPGTCIKIHFSHNQSRQSAPYLVCKARLSRKASRVYNHVHMSSS